MAGAGGFAGILEKYRENIIKDVDIEYVIPYLVRQGVIDFNENRKLYMAPTVELRKELLLDIISVKKDPQSFHEFCAALEISNEKLLNAIKDSRGEYERSYFDYSIQYRVYVLTMT